jgi:hypothetical protein
MSYPVFINSVIVKTLSYFVNEYLPHCTSLSDKIVRPEYIEHQLAHTVRDPNGRAYNRTAHLEERKKMMQQWGDYLDGLKTGAKALPFTKKAG